MTIKDLSRCRNIFLDSTVLVDLLTMPNDRRDDAVNERIIFTKSLISYLSYTKTTDNRDRHFIISAISLSEILTLDDERQKDLLKAIQILIGTSNFEVVSYTWQVAQYHNEVFRESLTERQLREIAREIEYPMNPYVNIRERMRKDYLIIATALYSNPDVVFTGDNAFFKLTEKIRLPCVETLAKNFLMSLNGDKFYGFQ